MDRKKVAIGAALAAALVVLVAMLWWSFSSRPQAEYNGQPTSYWRGEIKEYLHAARFGLPADTSVQAVLESLRLVEKRSVAAFRMRYPPLTDAGPPPIQEKKPDPGRLAVVLELIEDRDPGVRAYAAAFLVEAPAAAQRLLDDTHPDVRLAAVRSLEAAGPAARDAVGKLTELTEDTEKSYHVYAARAIWRIQGRPDVAVPILAKALRGSDRLPRQYATSILAEMGADAEGALEELRALSRHGEGMERTLAMKTLATFGKRSLSALIAGLADKDTAIQSHAVQGLGRIGPDAAVAIPDLERVRDTATLTLLRESADKALTAIDPRRFPAK